MDHEFSRKKTRKAGGVIAIVFGLFVLFIGGFWYISSQKNKMISPLPSSPSYEVIFYTPTPQSEPTVDISTPSATPKGQKPSPTPKPTKTPATPTVVPISPTPTS